MTTANPNCDAAGEDELVAALPWDVVGSFLGLRDVLSLRFSSAQWAASLHDGLGYRLCSAWLGDELVRRNVYAFNDSRHWRRARREDKEEEAAPLRHDREEKDVDDDDEPCLLRWLVREGRPTRTSTSTSSSAIPPQQPQQQQVMPSPFDLLLRCLRVVRYLPQQVTVAYSGKYGRHCWGLSGNHEAEPGIILYPDCHRGNRCPTCRTPIETVPMATSSDRPDRGRESPEINVDMTLCIPVGINTSRCVRLDKYPNKCLPNVPSDLVCPICRVTDRRTLVLTELSYQTEPGTERIAFNHRSFTFTPAHEDDDKDEVEQEESPLPRKRRRRLHRDDAERGAAGAHAGTGKPYPPMYRESFLHQYYEERIAMDVKHAISLHCDQCRRFGVLSPAHLRPLHELGQNLQARVDPSSRHVYFSSAFLQRAPPAPVNPSSWGRPTVRATERYG